MVLTVEKADVKQLLDLAPSFINNNYKSNSYKGKFKRQLVKPLSLWTSLFSNGLNACTIDAERQGWNAPRFGVGMFHIKAMMLGNDMYLIDDTAEDKNSNSIERLVLELSVKYDITPDKKVAKNNWNWSGMSPYIKDPSKYTSLLDNFNESNVTDFINDSHENQYNEMKCKKLCMRLNYAPELLNSRDSPKGVRYTYSKNRLTQKITNVTSYVLKQYFSGIETEVDDFMHNIINTGVNSKDLYLFNGGVISPHDAITLLDEVYVLSQKPHLLSNKI